MVQVTAGALTEANAVPAIESGVTASAPMTASFARRRMIFLLLIDCVFFCSLTYCILRGSAS